LHALKIQTYPRNLYEIIAVDNDSDDDIKKTVKSFPGVISAHEKKPSSYAARNKGISLAKGDILAFTDADCIPEKNWIEKGVKALNSTPNCGLVGGNIKLFSQKKPNIVERHAIATQFGQEYFVRHWKFAATANMFTFKHLMEKVGTFDSTLKSSGDLEWGQRILKAGHSQIYAHDVLVHHHARSTLSQLFNRERRLIGGTYDLQRKTANIQKPALKYKLDRYFSMLHKRGIKNLVLILPLILFVEIVKTLELVRLHLGGAPKR
jgi:glycosyltransferase involved in cell wall biosynthesis